MGDIAFVLLDPTSPLAERAEGNQEVGPVFPGDIVEVSISNLSGAGFLSVRRKRSEGKWPPWNKLVLRKGL